MQFPRNKADATLHVKSKRGTGTALLHGPFGDCAWVLSSILSEADDAVIWVESVSGRFEGAAVKRAYDLGVIKRANTSL